MIPLKQFLLPTVVQSPMADCTDLAFRLIARRHGMRFAFLEMISSEALVRNTRNTFELMKTTAEDKPVGAQIVGSDPAVMGEAAAKVEAMGFDLVDMNLGCPVPKVVCKGGGSQLLREPKTAERIFRGVVKAVKRVPVTVKMRLGYCDASGGEAETIARIAEDCGISAIAVHGRTRAQAYTGKADYEAIGRVKAAVKIPVIGNGDVVNGDTALRLRAVSSCDGVMLGRGALGNPWIYREVEAALNGESPPAPPTFKERKRTALWHLELQCQYEARPVGPLRRILCWYFHGLPGVADLRNAICRAQTVEEQRAAVEVYSPRLEPSASMHAA